MVHTAWTRSLSSRPYPWLMCSITIITKWVHADHPWSWIVPDNQKTAIINVILPHRAPPSACEIEHPALTSMCRQGFEQIFSGPRKKTPQADVFRRFYFRPHYTTLEPKVSIEREVVDQPYLPAIRFFSCRSQAARLATGEGSWKSFWAWSGTGICHSLF